MNRINLIVCCASVFFLQSCYVQKSRDTITIQKEYDERAKQMVRSMAYVGEPLNELTDDEMEAVAALLVMTRLASQSEDASPSLSGGFWVELQKICPPIPRAIQHKLGGCLDESIAYATSMARCLDEGKSEGECERESGGELSAHAYCQLRQLEEMEGIIRNIGERKWPPGPFPWPVESGGPMIDPHP